ncbi:MAG TPA: diguanylate cyclase [Nevskia sp.]|nr:diguanylate cyclase [Nevskia sp.]
MNTQSATSNRRILVIDDNQSIIEDFRKILGADSGDAALAATEAALFGDDDSGRGANALFQIDSACQGQEGFALVEQACNDNQPYAMAFIDMRMPPGWDGVETIEHIWRKDPKLQIVVCTAYSDYSWEEMSERLDLGDRLLILKKPFDNIEAFQLASTLTMKWEMTRQAELKMNALEDAVGVRTRALSEANRALETEVTERKALEKKLEQLSVTDALTSLANRRHFDNALEAEWQRASRAQAPLGLIMIDIDHFKLYNDHYGHIGGDSCLRMVASRLARETRGQMDLLARYGGEEFVIILPGADYDATYDVAQRCCWAIAGLNAPHAASPRGIVTISTGIASAVPAADGSVLQLVEIADRGLYEAKRAGRNRVGGRQEQRGAAAVHGYLDKVA